MIGLYPSLGGSPYSNVTISKFKVLVLKNDPCDVQFDRKIPRDAKFQTGPVYWIRLEEDEDDSYSESTSSWDSESGSDSRISEIVPVNSSEASLSDVGHATSTKFENWDYPILADSGDTRAEFELVEVQGTSTIVETENFVAENISTDGEGEEQEQTEQDTFAKIQSERLLLEEQQQALQERMRRLEEREQKVRAGKNDDGGRKGGE